MSKIIPVDAKFLEKQVKIVMNEVSGQERPENKHISRFFTHLGKFLKQSGKSAVRWGNKKLYSNDRKQAVGRIESDDPEVYFIKSFFNLFSKTCYKSSNYSTIYQDSWTFEDPGVYCLDDSLSSAINKWYKNNRQKSIKKLMTTKTPEQRVKVLEKFANDFRSEINSFFDSIPLIISSEETSQIIQILASDERFVGNWRAQWHGQAICAIDCFICLFSFVKELYFAEGPPRARVINRLGRIVSKSGDWSTAISGGLENVKQKMFVRRLRSNRSFRSKWSGFCLNTVFDPYGEKSLEHWIGTADTWKSASPGDLRSMIAATLIKYTARDLAVHQALKRTLLGLSGRSATAMAAGTAIGGPKGFILVSLSLAAADLFLWWDPFEWNSIRPELEEEFSKMSKVLEKLQKMLKSAEDPKLQNTKQLEEEFSNSIGVITSMLHDRLAEKMQANISSEFDNMSAKKAMAMEIQAHLGKISKLRDFSFDLKTLNSEDLSECINVINQFLDQSRTNGRKLKSINKKIGIEMGLGASVESLEGLNENLNENNSGDIHEKWNKIISDFYSVDLDDVNILSRARSIRDSQSGHRGLDSAKKALSNAVARQNQQAKSFEDWWEPLAAAEGEIKTNPNETSEFTILHRSWVNNPNGLKSENVYKLGESNESLFTRASGAFAICAIGLGHSLVNTSFYYGNSSNSSNLWKHLYERSKVKISGDSVELIDKGSQIQRIKKILNNSYIASMKGKMAEIHQYVNWITERISSDTEIETKGQEKQKLQAINLLMHDYYKKELKKSLALIQLIISKDEEFSDEMESLSRSLSALSPEEQNTNEHAGLQSKLRVLGAKKIMLFEALAKLR